MSQTVGGIAGQVLIVLPYENSMLVDHERMTMIQPAIGDYILRFSLIDIAKTFCGWKGFHFPFLVVVAVVAVVVVVVVFHHITSHHASSLYQNRLVAQSLPFSSSL
jgi:hypothetical protein